MPLALDHLGQLQSELPCLRCGYVLRGLKPEAQCPECAHPIRSTIAAQKACEWPTSWLTRIGNGISLMQAAVIAGIVFELALTHVNYGGMVRLSLDLSMTAKRVIDLILQAICLGCVLLLIWAAMVLTFSDAAQAVAGENGGPRRLTRRAFVVAAVLCVVLLFVRHIPSGPSLAIFVLSTLIGFVALWNLCTWLSRIVACFPNMRLARRIARLHWVLIILAPLAMCEALNIWPIVSSLPIQTSRGWNRAIVVIDTLVLTGRGALIATGIIVLLILRPLRHDLHGLLAAHESQPD